MGANYRENQDVFETSAVAIVSGGVLDARERTRRQGILRKGLKEFEQGACEMLWRVQCVAGTSSQTQGV